MLSPLFAIVAILIRRDDTGPVLFHQDRIGKDGTPFPMLKFRTMQVGAETMLESLTDRSEGQGPLSLVRTPSSMAPLPAHRGVLCLARMQLTRTSPLTSWRSATPSRSKSRHGPLQAVDAALQTVLAFD